MPWNASSVMDEKLKFVAEWLCGEEPRSVLCARYGISRETGYQWWRRYRLEGIAGLDDRSRAPRSNSRSMSAGTAVGLIELRKSKPYWGPKKLLAIAAERDAGAVLAFGERGIGPVPARRLERAASSPAAGADSGAAVRRGGSGQ